MENLNNLGLYYISSESASMLNLTFQTKIIYDAILFSNIKDEVHRKILP